jgi:hypothetical protein
LRQAIGRNGDEALVRRIEELRGGGDAFDGRLGDIEAQVNVLRQAVARSSEDHILQRIADLTSRIDGWESETEATGEKSENLVRLMGRLSSNYAEASAQADERLHKIEVALADLRLEHLSTREAPVASAEDVASLANRISAVERLHTDVLTPDDVTALESRVSAIERLQANGTPEVVISGPTPEEVANLNRRLAVMEARQADTLETLRTDIVRFVTDNDRRLGALEHTEVDYNLAAEFDALRRRVEERILGIEQRSVRTLEQVADTVQMLEERFMGGDDGERQTA